MRLFFPAPSTSGMMRRLMTLTTTSALLFSVSKTSTALAQQILIDDFELNTELGNYKSPTKIVFSKDGTLWATDKDGMVTVSDPNEYDNPRVVLDLSSVVCETGERGLESVAPHPQFDTTTNPYIWVFYSFNKHGGCAEDATTGAVMRLSRFTCLTGGSQDCDINSEMVFLETGSFPFDHHNGGDIAFGKDGLIYATIGDGGEMDTSQQRFNLFGTIVRLNPDNTVPATNPYAGEANSVRCGMAGGYSGDVDNKCSEIFAYGVRNPFRLIMNPNVDHVEFYLCDVGAGMWEEVTIGGERHAGANYGWPIREGPCKLGRNCNDDCSAQTDYLDPLHFYGHNVDGDGAIIGGAFVPNWGHWPTSYEEKFIYADFVVSSLFLMNPSTVGESRNSCPVRSGYEAKEIVSFTNAYPVSMAFNPLDGNLYFAIRSFGGKLNRVRYVGNNPSSTWEAGTTTTDTTNTTTTTDISAPNSTIHVNRSPQPMIQVSSTGGPAGTVVEFDGSTSTDPDANLKLLFEWDFDGDGIVDSTDVITSHQYNTNGIYKASLRVRDGKGGRAISYIEIGIGEYPVADILVPARGEKFHVGQLVQLTGFASGVNIAGNPDDYMEWEVRQHHNTHYHPFLDVTNGNGILLQECPAPEDLLAGTNSYLEVILTVTDDMGLKTTVTRDFLPKKRQVNIDSVPQGLMLKVDESEVTTPQTIVSWANHELLVEAPDDNKDQGFMFWSDNGSQKHKVTVPNATFDRLDLVAYYGASIAVTEMELNMDTPRRPVATGGGLEMEVDVESPGLTEGANTIEVFSTSEELEHSGGNIALLANSAEDTASSSMYSSAIDKMGGVMILLLVSLFMLI